MFTPVRVKFDTIVKRSNFHFENVARNLSSIIHQKFGRCKPCSAAVYAFYDNKMSATNENQPLEWFSMSFKFYTTERCQDSLIVKRLNQLLGKEIKLPIGTEYMTMTISAATLEEYGNYVRIDGGDMQVISSTCPISRGGFRTDFHALSRCPSVPLNYTDFTALMRSTQQMSKKRVINTLFKQGNGTTNTGNGTTNMGNGTTSTGNGATNKDIGTTYMDDFKVQACWETYISVLPKKNHGCSINPTQFVLFVVVMGSINCFA